MKTNEGQRQRKWMGLETYVSWAPGTFNFLCTVTTTESQRRPMKTNESQRWPTKTIEDQRRLTTTRMDGARDVCVSSPRYVWFFMYTKASTSPRQPCRPTTVDESQCRPMQANDGQRVCVDVCRCIVATWIYINYYNKRAQHQQRGWTPKSQLMTCSINRTRHLVMLPKMEMSSKSTCCNPSHPAPQRWRKGQDKFLLLQ